MPAASKVNLYDDFSAKVPAYADFIFATSTVFLFDKSIELDIVIAFNIDAVVYVNTGLDNIVVPVNACPSQKLVISSCLLKTPIGGIGCIDPVFVSNISVFSSSISLINSHVPIVPLLLEKIFILDISPVAGSNLLIFKSKKECEFCVGV